MLYLLPGELESGARWALAITAGTLAAWILRPVPLAATSVPVIFALGATSAASAEGAVAGFGSSATLLLVSGFMMAAAIEKTPLARRLTYLSSCSGSGAWRVYWLSRRRSGSRSP